MQEKKKPFELKLTLDMAVIEGNNVSNNERYLLELDPVHQHIQYFGISSMCIAFGFPCVPSIVDTIAVLIWLLS